MLKILDFLKLNGGYFYSITAFRTEFLKFVKNDNNVIRDYNKLYGQGGIIDKMEKMKLIKTSGERPRSIELTVKGFLYKLLIELFKDIQIVEYLININDLDVILSISYRQVKSMHEIELIARFVLYIIWSYYASVTCILPFIFSIDNENVNELFKTLLTTILSISIISFHDLVTQLKESSILEKLSTFYRKQLEKLKCLQNKIFERLSNQTH